MTFWIAGADAAAAYIDSFLWLPVSLLSASSLPPPRSIESYLWIPVTLLLTGYLYVVARRHND